MKKVSLIMMGVALFTLQTNAQMKPDKRYNPAYTYDTYEDMDMVKVGKGWAARPIKVEGGGKAPRKGSSAAPSRHCLPGGECLPERAERHVLKRCPFVCHIFPGLHALFLRSSAVSSMIPRRALSVVLPVKPDHAECGTPAGLSRKDGRRPRLRDLILRCKVRDLHKDRLRIGRTAHENGKEAMTVVTTPYTRLHIVTVRTS